ncbi:hypothetical protein MAR_002857 [Mya arenaria]|uniref:DUF7869 domain-containing protein n=1 Tax=Mya arenaria TaxID=6604 RepID=A0ABY7G7F0_MYAAR|nr:hypothetical protein MAR_002857 [Mya arenaria]
MKEGEPGPLQALHGQHTVHGNKRSREAISSQEMHSVMKIDCCQRRCCSYFTPEQVEESRTEYWALRQADQRKWLRKTIRDAQGKGKEAPASEVPRVRRPTEAGVHAAKWLEDYIRFFADRQPDREELHLPACLTKNMLFKSYEDEMKQGKIRPVSRSRFHEIWLQQMPNVKIRKDPDDLPQCQTCATIQTGLMQLPCKQDREKFLNLRSTHLELQARCRKKYYKHIRKAAKDGLEGRHLSLIIDGMDQAKTRLPRFSVYSKADAHLHKMQQHVTGIKVHNTNQTYLMTWTDTLHPDANVTINALVHVLHDISKETGRLPEVLYIQMDNSGKDNKNVFIILFMAWLVRRRVFRKVKIGFLMVGHTHEDIDQVFSRVSSHLRRQEVLTLPNLHKEMQDSQHPSPITTHLEGIFDYKKTMEGQRGLIEGISVPHHFIIAEDDGCVKMRYRDWPDTPDKSIDLTPSIPIEYVQELVPVNSKFHREAEFMATDIPKWQTCGKLPSSAVEWWRVFLTDASKTTKPSVAFVNDLPTQQPSLQTATLELVTTLLEATEHQVKAHQKVSNLKIRKRRQLRV